MKQSTRGKPREIIKGYSRVRRRERGGLKKTKKKDRATKSRKREREDEEGRWTWK